jgi:hypothetical protein
VTNTNQLKVTWLPVAYDGGSVVTSYSLEIDDGQGGAYLPVYNNNYLLFEYTISQGI